QGVPVRRGPLSGGGRWRRGRQWAGAHGCSGTDGHDHGSGRGRSDSRGGTGGSIEIVVAQYSADLGDGPANTMSAATRYRSIGFDLDQVCSTTGAESTCQL